MLEIFYNVFAILDKVGSLNVSEIIRLALDPC